MARADRAGVAVAAGPVGAAQARIGQPGEGAEQHEVEGQEQRQHRQRLQPARRRRAAPRCARQTHASGPSASSTPAAISQMRPARGRRAGSAVHVVTRRVSGPARPRRRRRAAGARGRAWPWPRPAASMPRREAHHPVAHGIDQVQMLGQRMAGGRRQPLRELLAGGTRSTRGRRQRRRQARRGTGAASLTSQTQSSRSLSCPGSRAAGAAGTGAARTAASQRRVGHAHQQPLALERSQRQRQHAVGVAGHQIRAAAAAARSARRRRAGPPAAPRSR